MVDFADDDKGSAMNALHKIKDKYPDAQITFCNGGIEARTIFLKWKWKASILSLVLEVMIRKTLVAGFLKSGNMRAKREYGASFIISFTDNKVKLKN